MTRQEITYRLYRLRRLLVAGSLLPLAGLAIGAQISGLGGILTGWAPLAVAGLGLAVLTALLLRFPNSMIEGVALSLSLTLTLALVPLIDSRAHFADLFLPGGGGGADAAVHMALAWMLGFFALVPAIALLDRVRIGQSTVVSTLRYDLAPDAAFDALTLKPDVTSPDRQTGTPDRDGFFDVTVWYDGADPETFAPARQSHTYRARIVEAAPLRQVTATVLQVQGRTSTSVSEVRVTPSDDGCLCESREVQDHLTLLSRMNFWLADYGADYLQGALDEAAGRESPALCRQSQRTFMGWLASTMKRQGPAGADPE
ncbi:hypothetical protein [Actibacterium ureilyticum]|uniref:hypothetical protein n=1 Tax=Actibacterium ureilyticum TaxID=1590614 RepID=UPI000BAA9B46|nr:hypothetical protein [Actibacterium ureilyticum]